MFVISLASLTGMYFIFSIWFIIPVSMLKPILIVPTISLYNFFGFSCLLYIEGPFKLGW
jgi:hypothetical protein